MRSARIERNTAETQITLQLNLDGRGERNINTGCGFLNHMLELFAKHGRFDLQISCHGDTEVDFHHTVEDVGICLGQAFGQALGDRRGMERYGSCALPMDEALVLAAVDLGGRDALGFDLPMPCQKVGDFDTELVQEFFAAFTRPCGCALHIRLLAGGNTHHIIEGAFKAVARALREAVAIDPAFADELPTTKGLI